MEKITVGYSKLGLMPKDTWASQGLAQEPTNQRKKGGAVMQVARMNEAAEELSGQHPFSKARLAIIVFLTLQCMDLLTTLAAFSHGGVELNPILNTLMPLTGRVGAIVASKGFLMSLVVLLSRRQRILYLANILYSAIVAWNLAIVFALR